MNQIIFTESLRFRNPLIFIILFGLLGISFWAVLQQIILGKPFGANPTPDALLIIFAMFPLLFLLLFIFLKQKTSIGAQGIEVIISPFGSRRIAWKNVDKAYIRAYKPLLEYGGWGIRFGFGKKGIAYSVGGGNKGLQLELKNGQKVLIGSKKTDELAKILEQHNFIG